MYLCSPVFGFCTITTCENGSYKGYLSTTFSPFGTVFNAGWGMGASVLCLKLIFSFNFLKPARDSLRCSLGNLFILHLRVESRIHY